jgi:hypothetical protein
MTPQLESAIARLKEKGDARGWAQAYEQELEDLRAAIKADAIQRIMKRDGCAATPAEKIVETDPDYFAHRETQRASIVARFKADAEYQAAKAEATQASLLTPDVLILEADNRALLSDRGSLLDANRSLLRARNEALAAIHSLGIEVADLHNQLRDANLTIGALEQRPSSAAAGVIP